MKKDNFLYLVAGLVIGSGISVFGSQSISALLNTEIKVDLNGAVQTFYDESTGERMYPLTYNNRTYLPLRNIARLTGLNVGYDNATNTALLSTGSGTSPIPITSGGTTGQEPVVSGGTTGQEPVVSGEISQEIPIVSDIPEEDEKLDFANIKKTSTKQHTNYKFFDDYDFYVAYVVDPEKTKITNMAKKVAEDYINLFNTGATNESDLFKSVIHPNNYITQGLEKDIKTYFSQYKSQFGDLYLSDFKMLDIFVNDNNDLACHITFTMYNPNTTSDETLMLLYENGSFKVLGNFSV